MSPNPPAPGAKRHHSRIESRSCVTRSTPSSWLMQTLDVRIEQQCADGVDAGAYCHQLGHDVLAGAVALEHARDAANLSLDTSEAGAELFGGGRCGVRHRGSPGGPCSGLWWPRTVGQSMRRGPSLQSPRNRLRCLRSGIARAKSRLTYPVGVSMMLGDAPPPVNVASPFRRSADRLECASKVRHRGLRSRTTPAVGNLRSVAARPSEPSWRGRTGGRAPCPPRAAGD